MNEQSYFHWDLFRPPIHSPSFAMGTSFLDIREEAMRGIPNKSKAFSFDQSCALWSKDIGLDPGDGIQNASGRVLEVRKEKSRDAARSRRGKENYEFYELAKLLPLPAAITSQLDKASIIRLSISYLKLRDFCGQGDPPWPRDGPSSSKTLKGAQRRRNTAGVTAELFEQHQGAHILQSLDGFAFTLCNDGRFLYISETVSIYLGLSQVEMSGSSIFDYVHTQDHQELADQLGIPLTGSSSSQSSPASPPVDNQNTPRAITPPITDRVPTMTPNLEKGVVRSFCIRMKSTLTKRGVHTRSSGYRVVLIVGQFRHQMNFGIGGRKSQLPVIGLSGAAIALPPPTITELRIEADTFIMRLTAKFKVIYCENMISNLSDWKCDDISGRDLYKFCHPGDIHLLRKTHSDLLMKGQVLSPSIRLLNKNGGYIWVQLCATSLYTTKTSDDQTVLAIFQTISSIEHRGVVMDSSQLDTASNPASISSFPTEKDQEPEAYTQHESPSNSEASEKVANQSPEIQIAAKCPETAEQTSVFPDSVDNDFLLDDHAEDSVKQDAKISRRKADRPRKRRRESGETCSLESLAQSTKMVKAPNLELDKPDRGIVNLSSNHRSLPNSPQEERTSQMTSPQLPEDLSFRAIVEKPTIPNCDAKETSDVPNCNNIISNSVKELEKVMNRHLSSRGGSGAYADDTNFQHRNLSDSQKSAIQWTGNSTSGLTSDAMSASAFLRHLYTSRESVIRSNGRPNCFNGEMSALAMLTPPSSDTCKDQLHLNIPHINVQSKNQYLPQKDPVSMITSPPDDFGITPPSSVSPQEKITSPFQDNEVTDECMRIDQGSHNSIPSASKHQFPAIVDTDSDLGKSHFLPMPGYQYHGSDMNHFSHNGIPGGVLYEPRPSSNHGVWFGSAYTS